MYGRFEHPSTGDVNVGLILLKGSDLEFDRYYYKETSNFVLSGVDGGEGRNFLVVSDDSLTSIGFIYINRYYMYNSRIMVDVVLTVFDTVKCH